MSVLYLERETSLLFHNSIHLHSLIALCRIYDKTVPKPVLDILAEMIASDPDLNVGPFSSRPDSDSGIPGVGLD